MSISVTVKTPGTHVHTTLTGAYRRNESLTITGLTAGADNTVPHGLPFTPRKVSYRPAKDGTTPGGWSETQDPDGTNLYITVNANGSTKGIADVWE